MCRAPEETVQLDQARAEINANRHPDWWDPIGLDVRVRESTVNYLHLGSELVDLDICRRLLSWEVSWSIRHGHGDAVRHGLGRRWLNDDQMRLAFGLGFDGRPLAPELIQNIAVIDGQFIRHGRYLKFPGPGQDTADAPLSLYLTDLIRQAVTALFTTAT